MKGNLITLIIVTVFTCFSCSRPNANSDANTKQDSIPSSSPEILAIQSFPEVTSYHLLVAPGNYTAEGLQKLVDDYREKNCSKGCNVYLYDDNSIKDLVTKVRLEDYEYLLLADHFVAESTFDAKGVKMYPFKDAKYKELREKK
jgi:hypothetical protein